MNIKMNCVIETLRGENDYVYIAHLVLNGRKVTLYNESFAPLLAKIQRLYEEAQSAQ